MSWLNDKCVKQWLNMIHSERTKENYRREFPLYLEFVQKTTEYKTPSQIIESRIEQLTSKDMNVKRTFEDIGIKYMHYLEKRGLRRNTIITYLRTMLSFFSKNHVQLSYSRKELIGAVEPSEADKVAKEWIPTNEEIRLFYRMCDSARDRAVLLVLYQSGFSEIDIANMKIEDFSFYNERNEWQLKANEDLYHERLREKTNIPQKTCVSREALEEIRIMLQQRGFPKEGYLFVSFRDKPLEVRGINDMLKSVVQKSLNGKVKLWKTKHLRDAFMNGLLQARIPQELKDSMVGHKREGARESYGINEQTIKTTYAEAFKFLTVNGFGSTSRKVEELETKIDAQNRALVDTITELKTKLEEHEKTIAKIKEFPDLVKQIETAIGTRFKRRLKPEDLK